MGNMSGRIPQACRTPGTRYGTEMTTRKITLTIELPLDLLSGTGVGGEKQLEADFHLAVLRVCEKLFHERWDRIKGQKISGAVMPVNWYDL